MPTGFKGTTNDQVKLIWDTADDFNLGTVPATLEISGSGSAAVVQLAEADDNNDDINFTTANDYTASDAAIQVTGGQAQLTETLPANGTFFAKFGSSIDADFSSGSATGTATGGASVAAGKLNLTSNDIRYVDYAGAGNADSAQTGCIRFSYTPNYTGNPSQNLGFFSIGQADLDDTNRLELVNLTDGSIRLLIMSSSDTAIVNSANLGAWSPVSGTTYEFELNYDITAGATRLFINGTQHGSTQTGTGTRDSGTIGLLRIGSNINHDRRSNAGFDNFIVFSAVQHTGNYTPTGTTAFYPTTDNLYVETEDASQIAPAAVVSWLTTTFTSSTPTNTDIRVLLSTNDRASWLTWNGSAWAAPNSATTRTDGTTPANVVTNIASLGVGSGLLDVRVFLYTSDGLNTPTVSNINVTSDAGFETAGVYETNIQDSGIDNLDWKTLSIAKSTNSGSTITVKAKASNDSSDMGLYGSAITNHAESNVTGRYIQFEVTFAGTTSVRPKLQSLGIFYIPRQLESSPE